MIVKFGNWIFHYRNFLFPLFYGVLFIPSRQIIINESLAELIGLFFVLSGIIIRSTTIALVYVIRGGKDRQIYANTLVTEGIYSICRNPLYLGNILLLLGFGLFANSTLFVLFLFPLFIFFYMAIIKAEENFLFNKFGVNYTIYKERVNALLPNLRLLSTAFKNHRFNLKRVLKKEQSALFLYGTGLLLIILYRERIGLLEFSIYMILLFILYAFSRYMKVNRLLE